MKRAITLTLLVGLAAIVGSGALGCKKPQMGADEEVFKTVDALFTAVRAHDDNLLGQCEQRLRTLKEAGKLPGNAADYLDRIIVNARGGRWEAAAEKLYDFMSAQRRPAAAGHHQK